MHEVSVVSDIVSAILKELENYNVERVEEVVLVVGDMTSLGDEQLEFAYEIVTKETKLEGSKLIIEHEKIRVKCKECDYEGEVRMLESDYGEHTIPIQNGDAHDHPRPCRRVVLSARRGAGGKARGSGACGRPVQARRRIISRSDAEKVANGNCIFFGKLI